MIHEALYRLKLEFGVLADVYKLTAGSTNYDTGTKSRTISRTRVRRAVKLPEMVKRQMYISPNFTQTNKPFITKGGGWDEVTDTFLFDGRDLIGYEFDLQDWVVWNHVRYEIKAIEEMGNKAGWAIGTTVAKGSPANEFHVLLVEQDLGVEDAATETVE